MSCHKEMNKERVEYEKNAYYRMPIGKHKNKYMKEVPNSYLEWCVTSVDGRVKSMASIELERRKRKKLFVPDMLHEFEVKPKKSTKIQNMNYELPFGKYKGWWVTDVPLDYLQYMSQHLNGKFTETKNKIGIELNRRSGKKKHKA
jgi:uncharacterized protein (DUF3820 family)